MNVESIIKSIKKYLSIVENDKFKNGENLSDADILKIKNAGFRFNYSGWSDRGKIFGVYNDDVCIVSTQNEFSHKIGLMNNLRFELALFEFDISKISLDPVRNIIQRDDNIEEKWFYSKIYDNYSIGIIKESDIPEEIMIIFKDLDEHVKKYNPNLRLRLFVDIDEQEDNLH